MHFGIRSLCAALLLIAGATFDCRADVVVRPPAGPLRGHVSPVARDVSVFKGIPFARPPVGELRWAPPQQLDPWTTVRDATEFGKPCPQPVDNRKLTDTSEDCLYLNIWTAADLDAAEKRPVMVWIHGGGFVNGAGSEGGYNGTSLAKRGIVVVTINYRLGALGFLAHPALTEESPHGASGNYGLMDQIAALRWVRDNIGAFGGDAGNVTVFGESAGAFSIARLMVSPPAEGLYHKAIIQSGTAHLSNPTLAEAEAYGQKFADALGARSISEMRDKSAEEIITAQKDVSQETNLFSTGDRFMPCADGFVLPDRTPALFESGKSRNVPLLIGTNADEGLAFMLAYFPGDEDAYGALMQSFFGDKAKFAQSLYPYPKDNPQNAQRRLGDLATVAFFTAGTRWLAEQHSGHGKPVFLYQFTRVPNTIQAKILGCHHALDIFYVFGITERIPGMTEEDHQLAASMQTYWTNFAKSGDPNDNQLPTWPRYDRDTDQHLELSSPIRAESHLLKDKIDGFIEHDLIH